MENERWFLLRHPWHSLQLGGLVLDYTNPVDDYCCPKHLVSKQKRMVQRYEDHDVTLAPSTTHSRTFRMISKGDDSSYIVRLEAHDYSIYQLQNPLTWLETLVASIDASDWLLNHFETHDDIYLVTGLQMLRDGDVTEVKLGTPSFSTTETWLPLDAFLAQVQDLRMKAHGEHIFAVSCLKISLQLSQRPQTPTSLRELNWLRPWSWWSRKVPPYPLKSQRGPIHELVIQSAEFQEAMQLKSSRTPPETEEVSIDTDDSVLAALSVLFGPSADGSSLGMQVWTNLLLGSSDLGPLYSKATKIAPEKVFEWEFFWLLDTFAEDLNGSAHSKSRKILTRFVKRYARRTAWLLTRHIYAWRLRDPLDTGPVKIGVPPSLDQLFTQLEAQNALFTSYEEIRTPVDDPNYNTMKVVLLSRRHHSLVTSFLFNGPACSKLQSGLVEFMDTTMAEYGSVDIYAPGVTWCIIALLAFIMVLGPLGIAFIYGILYTFGPMSLPTIYSKVETHITNSLTRFIYYLRVKFRPRVKPGHQRIEWICVCIRFPFYV